MSPGYFWDWNWGSNGTLNREEYKEFIENLEKEDEEAIANYGNKHKFGRHGKFAGRYILIMVTSAITSTTIAKVTITVLVTAATEGKNDRQTVFLLRKKTFVLFWWSRLDSLVICIL